MYRKLLLILMAICCMAVSARSQDKPDVVDKIAGFPSSLFNKINVSIKSNFFKKTKLQLHYI